MIVTYINPGTVPCIIDGNITLQSHVYFKSVLKNTGDFWSVLIKERFPFHNGGKGEKFMRSPIKSFDKLLILCEVFVHGI